MRVAIYSRVSTNGKNGGGRGEQDPANQLIQLREWCTRCGHEIVREYIDRVSGGKGADGLNFLERSRMRTNSIRKTARKMRYGLTSVQRIKRERGNAEKTDQPKLL